MLSEESETGALATPNGRRAFESFLGRTKGRFRRKPKLLIIRAIGRTIGISKKMPRFKKPPVSKNSALVQANPKFQMSVTNQRQAA